MSIGLEYERAVIYSMTFNHYWEYIINAIKLGVYEVAELSFIYLKHDVSYTY